MDRRHFLVSAGAATVAAGCGPGTGRDRAAPTGRGGGDSAGTYVLVHGAWHGGWCWRRVADRLRAAGHRVFTPTQTGLGERSHLLSADVSLDVFVTDVVNVLEWEDLSDVVLVGHSFGGIVVTGVADRVPQRIRHLVFLDALILRDGESLAAARADGTGAGRRRPAGAPLDAVAIPPPDAAALGVTRAADVAWVEEKCTPHPRSTFADPLRLEHPVGNGLPVTYVAVTPPFEAVVPAAAFAREQEGWNYVEIAAGHDAMVTDPDEVAAVLSAV